MKNLIEALRETADGIENNTMNYGWYLFSTCNCGLVAQTMFGISMADLQKQACSQGMRFDGVWHHMAEVTCEATGRPVAEIINRFIEAGLTKKDIKELEHCKNPEVIKRIGFTKFDEPLPVARYMRAWADILEEERDARLEAIELRELKPCGDVGRAHPQNRPTLLTESRVASPEGGKK